MKLLRELLTLVILSLQLSFATGPSQITSVMVPIAVNDKGDVLCKHYFSENWMGAHAQMPEVFALCLVKDGQVVLLEQVEKLYPDRDADWAVEFAKSKALRDRFEAISFTPQAFLLSTVYEEFIQRGFKKIDLEAHRLMPAFSPTSFKARWEEDYFEMTQVAINSSQLPGFSDSLDLTEDLPGIELLYQIGNQMWLQTADDIAQNFDYSNARIDFYRFPFGDEEMGYDLQKTTSIIFLPED